MDKAGEAVESKGGSSNDENTRTKVETSESNRDMVRPAGMCMTRHVHVMQLHLKEFVTRHEMDRRARRLKACFSLGHFAFCFMCYFAFAWEQVSFSPGAVSFTEVCRWNKAESTQARGEG